MLKPKNLSTIKSISLKYLIGLKREGYIIYELFAESPYMLYFQFKNVIKVPKHTFYVIVDPPSCFSS